MKDMKKFIFLFIFYFFWLLKIESTPENCIQPKASDTLKDIFITEGESSRDFLSYKKNIKDIKEALKKDPNDARNIFYLAQSYYETNKKIKALKLYSKRISLKGNEEEVFLSMLHAANIKRELDFPIESIINSYYQVHRYRYDRIEPIYYLADIFNHEKKYKLAYEIIKAFDFCPNDTLQDKITSPNWIKDFGLLYQQSISTYFLGKYQESLDICKILLNNKNLFDNWREHTEKRVKFLIYRLKDKMLLLNIISTEDEIKFSNSLDNFEYKKVLIAILARNKAHVLPIYLKCIENLDYDKKYVTIYINTNNNSDNTLEILKNWIDNNKDKYSDMILDHHECKIKDTNPHHWTVERLKLLGKIRNISLKKTFEYSCDYYFTADCDNFIFPCALKELIKKDKPIIAPMLHSIPNLTSSYSNFFYNVNEGREHLETSNYYKIVSNEMIGTFKVPIVHCTYLIKENVIDKLNYLDESNDFEFEIFSRIARNNNIDQYICNEQNFGLFLFRNDLFLNNVTIEDEKKWLKDYLEKF